MIVGIGNDILEIERLKKAINKNGFLTRYFTKREIELYNIRGQNPGVLSGNFAVKEAVSKVFGTGFRGFSLIDIEVLRDDQGKPFVNLYGQAKVLAVQLGIDRIHVSISNSKEYVSAIAIGEHV